MISVLIQFTSVIAQIHKGHLFLNYITHLTENYDGNLEDVRKNTENQSLCQVCTYEHSANKNRYEIEVVFPIELPALMYQSEIRIKGITVPFE